LAHRQPNPATHFVMPEKQQVEITTRSARSDATYTSMV
jgi:hypothetical protein